MIALLDQFDRRASPRHSGDPPNGSCHARPSLILVGLHCVDFRATDLHPLKRLIWGITSRKARGTLSCPIFRETGDNARSGYMSLAAKTSMLRRTKLSPKRGSIRLLPNRPIKSPTSASRPPIWIPCTRGADAIVNNPGRPQVLSNLEGDLLAKAGLIGKDSR
jgi:hypothetical protein